MTSNLKTIPKLKTAQKISAFLFREFAWKYFFILLLFPSAAYSFIQSNDMKQFFFAKSLDDRHKFSLSKSKKDLHNNQPPDLSGEWIYPCQNLETNDLVVSRVLRLAYIEDQVVMHHSDFLDTNCQCKNLLEEFKILLHFKWQGEDILLSGVHQIDYWRIPFYQEEFLDFNLFNEKHLGLAKKEDNKLYLSFSKKDNPKIRPKRLDKKALIFSRSLTESLEEYMNTKICP